MLKLPSNRVDLEFRILEFLAEQTNPQGAGTVLEGIRNKGIHFSEATIGRVLRELRIRGFLEKLTRQGHIITSLGEKYLCRLEGERELRNFIRRIPGEQTLQNGVNLVDVLIARKALEREATYQATLNATEDELLELEKIVQSQYEDLDKNVNCVDISVNSTNFHAAIFKASKISLLETLYEIIGISSRWQKFFVDTFKFYHTPLNVSHERILAAMKSRDAALAAKAMSDHLDDLIANAKKLFPEIT